MLLLLPLTCPAEDCHIFQEIKPRLDHKNLKPGLEIWNVCLAWEKPEFVPSTRKQD